MGSGKATMVGRVAPALSLADTSGRVHELPEAGEAAATVVIWTCNHCPYALAWHPRIVDAAHDYEDRGVRFFAVNSNDAESYPADSPAVMQERVESEDWPFPYLHDESQTAAHAWNAQVTPHLFVLDGELVVRYEGAADADHMTPAENAVWLREALDSVLRGEEPARPATDPVGCSIKWK